MASFQDFKAQRTAEVLSSAEFSEAVATLSETYLSALRAILEGAEFRDVAWCYRHNEFCPVTPRHQMECRPMIWCDGSGSICCPWSTMGARNMWLDRATLAFLTWCFSTRYYEPDCIIHECVVGFPEQMLEDIFGPNSGGALLMKSPRARPPIASKEGYLVRSHVWSPSDLGIPSNRPRKYTSMHLRRALTHDTVNDVAMATVFYRRLQVDASVYLAAPESAQALESAGSSRRQSCAIRGENSESDGQVSSADHILSTADYVRMEGYVVEALKRGRGGLCAGSSGKSRAILGAAFRAHPT